MPLPLLAAAPLAAGALAYLAAKSDIGFDMKLLKMVSTGTKQLAQREKDGTLNLFYDLERQAQDPTSAARNLVWFEGRTVTFGQMYDQALRYGHWLRTKFDVKPGDVVAMDFDNGIDFSVLWFAIWSIGAKPAFININLTLEPLAHCIRVSTAKLCLYESQFAANMEAVKGQVGNVQLFEVSQAAHAEARAAKPVRLPDEARAGQRERDLAMLIYTSGTTGLPKPAVVSWRKVLLAGSWVPAISEMTTDDILYTAMPMYHSLASVFGLLAATVNGHTVAVGRKFSNKTFWPDVRASKATRVLYIGEAMRYLLTAPPQYDPATGECLDKKHHVQRLIGSGLRPDVWSKVQDRFGIEHVAELYAATESTVSTWNTASNPSRYGAVGRAGWILRGMMWLNSPLVAVDWDKEAPWRDPVTGFCKKVPTGTPGELLSKLPVDDIESVFQGYHNNDKATDSKILRDVFVKGDAYFRTGDVLRWGEDGMLYFSDRLGDTFRWKGENVSTSEVSHMMGLHDAVHEANVYGVELPHHDGRAGCAAVTFSTGTPSQASLSELAVHLRAKLPKYAVPIFIRVVDEVGTASQTTGTNKQQKVSLRKQGAKPSGSPMFWLKGDSYVPFGDKEWRALNGGQVKL